MKLFVATYKVGWREPDRGYVSMAGFPFQMRALSELFDETRVTLLLRPLPHQGGVQKVDGHALSVFALPEPRSTDWRRKLALLIWLPRYLPAMWREIQSSDVVHAPVPGDIGFIGMLIALIQRKRLFVRHCGTWGSPVTFFDRVLLWFLETIASEQNVVMATGGDDQPPSRKNQHVSWIFSTTLRQAELDDMPAAPVWQPGQPLRLVTVCRLSAGKNVQAIIAALPKIREKIPAVSLDVVGDGEMRLELEQQAKSLGVQDTVNFSGNVAHAEVLAHLSSAHMFVFPTLTKEGFPKAVLEALACGLPVVATRVSIIPLLIRNCGVVLDNPVPDEVAQGVFHLLQDPAKLSEMSNIARLQASAYTLEGWRDTIGARLESAWGPLKTHDANT